MDRPNRWTESDRRFMASALRLARRGLTRVEPNPAVGAVLVQSDGPIGQGWHRQFGKSHAEIEAIEDARRLGNDLHGSTLYVTLEPCCHWGKTGPCTEAILREGIARVVVAAADPFDRVGGKGIKQLQDGGVSVEVGLLEAEARALNAWWYKFYETGRPWVIGKWAQTLDGKFACANGHSQWISSPASRKVVHALRWSVRAIVTGSGTVASDDPELTVRLAKVSPAGPPLRVVLDSRARIGCDSRLVATSREVPVLVMTGPQVDPQREDALRAGGCEVWRVGADEDGLDLDEVVGELGRRGAGRVLVEAGATLMSGFLRRGLLDELVVFVSSALAMDPEARQLSGLSPETVDQFERRYALRSVRRVGDDVMLVLWRR